MKKLLTVLVLCLCLVGCSNENEKIRVGVIQLVQHDALDAATAGFKETLEKEFGENVVVDVQNASGDSATCATIASNFVNDGYDLIMCNATPALQAAVHSTDSIPILGTSVTEYGVALGIDGFNGLVGKNVSGTSDLAPLDQQAQMIIDLVPSVNTVGLIYCSSEANSIYQVNKVEEYLTSKGLKVEKFSFADTSTVDAVVNEACSRIDALYVPTDNVCADNGAIIANAANKYNIPIVTGEKSTLITCEGLATLSIDYHDLGVTTANMAIRILKGEAKIEEMPIEYFENPVKIISKKAADKFGVTIPSDFEVEE